MTRRLAILLGIGDNHSMRPAFEDFLEKMTRQLAPSCTALGLTGSFARNDPTPYSDVDFGLFVDQLPADQPRASLRLVDGYLVSTMWIAIPERRLEMQQPDSIIWSVGGMRQLRILHDPTGALAALKSEAAAFKWEDHQPAVKQYLGRALCHDSEEVAKLLGGLTCNRPAAIVYALDSIILNLTTEMAVHLGVFMNTENTFYSQVQAAAGLDSEWTRLNRRAAGFESIPQGVAPYVVFGEAALRLFQCTASHLDAYLLPEQREVVQAAISDIHAYFTSRAE